MSKTTDAEMLRAIVHSLPDGAEAEVLQRVAYQLDIEAKRLEDLRKLQDIGRRAAEGISGMVAALECDYDRLEELKTERSSWLSENPGNFLDPNDPRDGARWALAFPDEAEELAGLTDAAGECVDREDAEQRIQEDPLSIELSAKWQIGETPTADRAYILLGTGGPATRIVCELDEHLEPHRAWIEAQDWGTPWTEYHGDAISSDDLLSYCRCFFYGEG